MRAGGGGSGTARCWRPALAVLVLVVMVMPVSPLGPHLNGGHSPASSVQAHALGLIPETLPAGRGSNGMAYDYSDGYLLMFGGSEPGQIYLNDTWAFTGGHWTQLHPAHSPPARDLISGQMAWDPFDGYVLLFSGRGATNLTDTWYWQAGDWHEVCSSCAPPVQQGVVVADASDGYMLEIAGQRESPSYSDEGAYWSYVRGTWTDLGVAPFPARQNMGAFYDPSGNQVVTFGGFVYQGGTGACFGSTSTCRDTWSYSGGTWTELCTGGIQPPTCTPSPPAAGGPEGAWDPTDGYGLMWGGQNASTGNTNASWTWSSGAWTVLPNRGERPASAFDAIAFDANPNDRSVATFGGNPPAQTWVWRNGGWSTPYALEGTVTDAATGLPIAGANVTDGARYAITNSTGAYSLTEVNATYALQVSAAGYATATGSAAVSGSDLTVNFALGAPGSGTLSAAAGASPASGVAPLSVAFTGVAAGGTSPYTYAWRFGDGTGSVAQDPNHVYTSAGSYIAKLWANDSAAHSAVAQVSVSVSAPPPLTATASATPTSGTTPLAVQFYGSGAGGSAPYSFAWKFGDGSFAAVQSPSHVYSAAGSYFAKLWVNDSASGSASSSVSISVTAAVVVSMTATPTSGPAPLSVGFAATASGGTGPYSYTWNFGDGTSSLGATVSHIYTFTGNFSVSVSAQDSIGDSGTSPATTIHVLAGAPGAPPTRDAEGLAYDYADGYLLMFGGSQPGQIYLNDTWAFSGAHWTQLHPAHSPPARDLVQGQMVWDPFDGYVLLFGGRGATNLTDTWYWQAGDWHQICVSCGPAVQQGLTVADLADGYVLEIAGQREYPNYNDEAAYWAYLGGVWTNLGVAPFPLRQNMGGFYDPVSHEVIAFGGYDYSGGSGVCTQGMRDCGDTWSYSAGVWTQVCTGGLAPPSCAQSPPAVLGPESAWDPFDGYGLMWGGQNLSIGADTNAAWTWSSNGWQQLPPSSSRPGDCCNAAAFDANTNDLSLVSYTGTTTWVWRNGAWYPPHAIFGTVTDASTGAPIVGANVTDGTRYALTNASGGYALTEVDSAYGVTASAGGYASASSTVTVAGYDVRLNFSLSVGGSTFTASASASPTSGAGPLTVSFVGTGSGGTAPYSFAWRFGDGGSSTSASSSHTYSAKGTYVARLWVNDSASLSATAKVSIYVTSGATLAANALASPSVGNAPLPVAFTGAASGGTAPYTFYWNFGDGSVGSAAPSPVHTFNGSGTYRVVLTVTDAAGSTARATVQVVVNGTERSPSGQQGLSQTTLLTDLVLVAVAATLAAVSVVLWRRRYNNLRGGGGGSANGSRPGTLAGSGYNEYELPRGPMGPAPSSSASSPPPPGASGGREGGPNAPANEHLRDLL